MHRQTVCRQAALLASFGEKRLNHLRAFGGQDSGSNFNLMIQTRVRKDLEAGACRAAFGVVRSINKAWYACLNHRPGAHAARLDRYVQSCAREPVIVDKPRGLAKNDDFRVGRGVAIANRTVARAREDSAVKRQHSPDRNFPGSRRGTGFLKSFLHEAGVGICHRFENNTRR
jgi:hypothetical protein